MATYILEDGRGSQPAWHSRLLGGDIGRGKECHAGCMVVVVKTIHTYIICVRYLLHMLGEEREGREA